jgi:hypothetical protein
VERVGAAALAALREARGHVSFIGGVVQAFGAAIRRPRQMRRAEVSRIFEDAGIDALPIGNNAPTPEQFVIEQSSSSVALPVAAATGEEHRGELPGGAVEPSSGARQLLRPGNTARRRPAIHSSGQQLATEARCAQRCALGRLSGVHDPPLPDCRGGDNDWWSIFIVCTFRDPERPCTEPYHVHVTHGA